MIEKELLRVILLQDWDPLLIGDNQFLKDEYDEYLDKLYKILTAGDIVYKETIYNMLVGFEDDLGFFISDKVRSEIVEKIWKIR